MFYYQLLLIMSLINYFSFVVWKLALGWKRIGLGVGQQVVGLGLENWTHRQL